MSEVEQHPLGKSSVEKSPEKIETSITERQKQYLIEHTKTPFEVAKAIAGKRTQFYLFGGTVRNLLLEKQTVLPDYDFIGDFDLDQIQKNFPDLVAGRWDEVSTIKLRIGSVVHDFTATKNLKETLAQGDITISNICLKDDGSVLDYFGGLESLRNKEIKIIDPEKKKQTHPGRILRIFRFAAELGFTVEEETLRAAIKNAHLLEQTDKYKSDIWKILALDHDTRAKILKNLQSYGIDRHISYPNNEAAERLDILSLEEEVNRCAQINEVVDLFKSETYLIGGAPRDLILGKKVKDFDFKVKRPLLEMIEILEQAGYTRTTNLNLTEGQYYVNEKAKAGSIFIKGMDADFTEMTTTDVPTLISQGDVNFSCCVFNANTKKIENPELMRVIKSRELRFCNPERARKDPIIIINALKQMSRIPDIVIPFETRDIVSECIPDVIQLIRQYPTLKYKMALVCGNLNSEEVYPFFEGVEGGQEVFEGLDKKRRKLLASSPQYASLAIKELPIENKEEIIKLVKTAYGKHCDESKIFSEKINSVVLERKMGKIQSCCLVDGERVYAAAARNGADWIAIVTDLVRNNYNVWATVDSENPKIQALCSVAGLKMETNPEVVTKILESKTGKRREDVEVYEQNGLTVFKKRNQDDYPQVLLRS